MTCTHVLLTCTHKHGIESVTYMFALLSWGKIILTRFFMWTCMRENWTCHKLMSDVIVDSKLTCMYISIDALVGIRLAKLVMYFVFFTWTFMCTRNLKLSFTLMYKKLETVIHIDVDQGRCSADLHVHIHRGHSQTFDSWLTYMYIYP